MTDDLREEFILSTPQQTLAAGLIRELDTHKPCGCGIAYIAFCRYFEQTEKDSFVEKLFRRASFPAHFAKKKETKFK